MKARSALFILLIAGALAAQSYRPSETNLKARQWFQDAKLGMFVHWGVYSVLGDGEWVMNNQKIPVSQYETLAARFNPAEYDPAEWVRIAKGAGMKYITITSKHHDGFAMFHTRQSPWNIFDATPYKKDPLKMLADECHRQGIKLFFYHSQLDWHHPDYYPLGRTGRDAGRPEGGDFNRYLDFMDSQLTELLTNYGEIGGIWFDGWWDRPRANWRLERTYSLIHRLQPAALVGSNHHQAPKDGEDFQMFEKDLPGGNTAGFNAGATIGALPLETCETINDSWGYNWRDQKFKTRKQLIQYLVRAAGNNANFLLNVGPMPSGKIQPEFVNLLGEVGSWMSANGETIYGTRGGPVNARPWGVTTRRDNRIYVHILDWNDGLLALPKLPPIRKASMFATGAAVEVKTSPEGTVLVLPKQGRDPVDTIVVLETGA